MHRVLERQFRRLFGNIKPEDLGQNQSLGAGQNAKQIKDFLDKISETYEHADEDRALLTHSLELSSKEFADINKRLRSENEIIEAKVKERTKELEYEKTKLNEIAENMRTGSILLDSQGQVTFVNATAKNILAKTLTAAHTDKNDAITSLARVFSSIPVNQHIQTALTGNMVQVAESECDNKIYAISFVPLEVSAGVFGVLIWIDDITDQKLLDRAKNQFIAIASHEMRTPLAIIRGNAELLRDEEIIKKNKELSEEVNSILKNTVRLLGIVNDFLDLQNIEDNRKKAKIEPVDIVPIIEETIFELNKIAEEKKVYIKFNVRSLPTLPALKLDRNYFQQILLNIVGNAIHYTNKGGVSIEIIKDKEDVKIFFTDTGVGIDPEDQDKLFRKFGTGKSFLKTKEYGSGLGLYISSLLASIMGCTLKLEESHVGIGTTFSLTIKI